MERKFFKYTGGWDILGTLQFAFYDATLVVDVGPYKAGTKFACVNMYYDDHSKMDLYEKGSDEDPVYSCKLELGVSA